MRPSNLTFLFVLLMAAACASKRTSREAPLPPPVEPVGWITVAGSTCFAPPRFGEMDAAERRYARGDTLAQMTRRWRGEIDSGFALQESLVAQLENYLLAHPENIESVSRTDFDFCSRWAEEGRKNDAYQASLQALATDLTAGSCNHTAFGLITHYIEVDRRWQAETVMCEGDKVRIEASGGLYTVAYQEDEDATRWVTAEGDPSQPARGTGAPCQSEDCYIGQLIARFVSRDQQEIVFPINLETTFVAPAHGSLFFCVNDLELYDNRFKVTDGAKDYLSIEIWPDT